MPTTNPPWIRRHDHPEHNLGMVHKPQPPRKINWRFIAFTAALTAAWFVTALVLVELVGR